MKYSHAHTLAIALVLGVGALSSIPAQAGGSIGFSISAPLSSGGSVGVSVGSSGPYSYYSNPSYGYVPLPTRIPIYESVPQVPAGYIWNGYQWVPGYPVSNPYWNAPAYVYTPSPVYYPPSTTLRFGYNDRGGHRSGYQGGYRDGHGGSGWRR